MEAIYAYNRKYLFYSAKDRTASMAPHLRKRSLIMAISCPFMEPVPPLVALCLQLCDGAG